MTLIKTELLLNSQTFKILTDAELATGLHGAWNGAIYNWSLPNSCNDVMANRTSNSGYGFVSGMLSLNGFRAVYLSNSALSSPPRSFGARGVIRIPFVIDFSL